MSTLSFDSVLANSKQLKASSRIKAICGYLVDYVETEDRDMSVIFNSSNPQLTQSIQRFEVFATKIKAINKYTVCSALEEHLYEVFGDAYDRFAEAFDLTCQVYSDNESVEAFQDRAKLESLNTKLDSLNEKLDSVIPFMQLSEIVGPVVTHKKRKL